MCDTRANLTESLINQTIETIDNITQPCRRDEVDQMKLITRMVATYGTTSATIVMMISMGCAFEIKTLIQHLKRPAGILICSFCQFILFPLSSFGMAHALNMSVENTLGMLILTTSPGGTVSNIFCFWAGGDVTLSISLTTTSTALAIGMMPLNLWLYGRSWHTETFSVPYVKICVALTTLVIPVAVGLLIKTKLPKLGEWIKRIGAILGISMVAVIITLTAIAFPVVFQQSKSLYISAFILPMVGFGLGFLITCVLQQEVKVKIAITLEVAFQNVGLAMAIISISFNVETFAKMIYFPQVYSITMLLEGVFVCILWRLYSRLTNGKHGRTYEVPDHETVETENLQMKTPKDEVEHLVGYLYKNDDDINQSLTA